MSFHLNKIGHSERISQVSCQKVSIRWLTTTTSRFCRIVIAGQFSRAAGNAKLQAKGLPFLRYVTASFMVRAHNRYQASLQILPFGVSFVQSERNLSQLKRLVEAISRPAHKPRIAHGEWKSRRRGSVRCTGGKYVFNVSLEGLLNFGPLTSEFISFPLDSSFHSFYPVVGNCNGNKDVGKYLIHAINSPEAFVLTDSSSLTSCFFLFLRENYRGCFVTCGTHFGS